MADTAPVMIWLSRADGDTEWVNRTWLQFTGKSLNEIVAEGIQESIHSEDRERHAEVYRRSLASRQPFRVEYRLCRHDGEFRWVLDTGVPRFEDPETFSGFIGSVIDITERKVVENERESRLEVERAARTEADALRLAAEQANVAKAQFLAAMSHELRTPLNAIAGYVELLEMGVRGQLNRAQLDDLARIRRNQRHLLGVINNILNFAKVEAGHVDFQIEDVALDDLLEGMRSLIEPQREAKQLSYRCEVPDRSLVVRSDADKVQQILLNLLSNAIKFTPEGGRVTIGVRGSDGICHLTVADTGIGIAAGELGRIGNPFVQLSNNSGRHPGTGLGLALVRALAEMHGGTFRIESEEGSGTTVTVTLPLAVTAAAVAA
jgi:PAS domain S-box-containing protein